jgi:hypothetical protein
MSTVNSGSSSRKQIAAAAGTPIKKMTIMDRSFSTMKNGKGIVINGVFPE